MAEAKKKTVQKARSLNIETMKEDWKACVSTMKEIQGQFQQNQGVLQQVQEANTTLQAQFSAEQRLAIYLETNMVDLGVDVEKIAEEMLAPRGLEAPVEEE